MYAIQEKKRTVTRVTGSDLVSAYASWLRSILWTSSAFSGRV
jgi:hypothetical protein